jgi:hypothetical protein
MVFKLAYGESDQYALRAFLMSDHLKRFHTFTFDEIMRIWQSSSFWHGVAAGMSPQRYLLTKADITDHCSHHDAVEDAWKMVAEVLNHHIEEFDPNGEKPIETVGGGKTSEEAAGQVRR